MIAVIGDVHGCYYTFRELINKIKKDYSIKDIYCTGDLIDRGLHGAETIEYVINENILSVLGNHDAMMLAHYREPGSTLAKNWKYNGSESTIKSYERNPDYLEKHIEFLQELPLYYNLDHCFISHAGICDAFYDKIRNEDRIDMEAVERVSEEYKDDSAGILWCRGKLADLGKLQVVGHSPQYDVRPGKRSNVMYIDTGAYSGNKLSAVILDNENIVDTINVSTISKDIR